MEVAGDEAEKEAEHITWGHVLYHVHTHTSKVANIMPVYLTMDSKPDLFTFYGF